MDDKDTKQLLELLGLIHKQLVIIAGNTSNLVVEARKATKREEERSDRPAS